MGSSTDEVADRAVLLFDVLQVMLMATEVAAGYRKTTIWLHLATSHLSILHEYMYSQHSPPTDTHACIHARTHHTLRET